MRSQICAVQRSPLLGIFSLLFAALKENDAFIVEVKSKGDNSQRAAVESKAYRFKAPRVNTDSGTSRLIAIPDPD